MNNNINHLDSLKDIKNIMERSSRFITLSGKSGIAAGIIGLVSAFTAHKTIIKYYNNYNERGFWSITDFKDLELKLFLLGLITLALAFASGFYFTWQKAKQDGIAMWNASSKRLVVNLCLPLLTGGIFIVGMLVNGEWLFIGPACLIFYGLALINGSKYTYDDIRYLGLLEILLGSINLFYIGYGLDFWAIGFGILHIVYGAIMWNKYDRHSEAPSN
jgi:hypothetical protein